MKYNLCCLLLLMAMQFAFPQTAYIDSVMNANYRPTEPGGVLLVSKKGQVIYHKAFGMANMEWQIPMTTDALFQIGSLTKQFTAVCILQLYEQGKLSLHDTVGKFVSDCSPGAGAVTIHQLLNHTSGLAEEPKRESKGNLETKVKGFVEQPLQAKAGSTWAYNNGNYWILGYIIEKLSGMSFSDYLNTYIFKPAGMTSACLGNKSLLLMHRAAGYRLENGKVLNDPIGDPHLLHGAGGIVGNTQDMQAWVQALYAGKLIKKETLARAFMPGRLSDGSITKYGYGWHIEKIQHSTAHRHGGSAPGYITEAVYLPQEEVYVVLLTNRQSKTRTVALTRLIAGMAMGKPYSFTAVPLDSTRLPNYQGVYENEFKEKIMITVEGNALYFQRPGGNKYELKASSPAHFFLGKDYVTVDFTLDEQQRARALVLSRVGIMEVAFRRLSN